MDNQENYIVKNIENFISLSNTKTAREMANRIGVPENTWRSFMKNPSSNSIAKTKFCLYYGLTVKQLETTLFDDDFIKSVLENVNQKEEQKKEAFLVDMSDEDLRTMFEKSDSKSDRLEELKRKVKTKTSLSFKINLQNAKKRAVDNPDEALALFNGTFMMMQKGDVNYVSENDLKIYVDLTVDNGNFNCLETLIATLIKDDFYNYKVVTVLALILEEVGLTDYAEQCLSAVAER